MGMTSSARHRLPFVASASHAFESDVRLLLDALRQLPISPPIKKRMLSHALWEVAFATGNKQGDFRGRYRSEGVLEVNGAKIQRDHIFPKERLIAELLGKDPDLNSIIARSECCLVTEAEHRRLGSVPDHLDGWERYRHAGVGVYDMATTPPTKLT